MSAIYACRLYVVLKLWKRNAKVAVAASTSTRSSAVLDEQFAIHESITASELSIPPTLGSSSSFSTLNFMTPGTILSLQSSQSSGRATPVLISLPSSSFQKK